ncbi:DDE-type integrase/transposase/recombinase [Neisseria weixii]|nr:DDE-type integrase/transposase/recombinase [Neisseria weixii]
MNILPIDKKVQVIQLLLEGCSMRSIERIVGCSINTVTKLLVDTGRACFEYQDLNLRNLTSKLVQCNEIWSFVYAKQRNVPEELKGIFGYGDVYTWTALDTESKLILSWLVGARNADCAKLFMQDVASRLANRVQLTTDGHHPYLQAVEDAFGGEIDYAMLVKLYGSQPTDDKRRYSPSGFKGAYKQIISGSPVDEHISTSFVERQNLTMRMHMRRFTRLTNGFSKKVENHMNAVSLHFMYYNFGRIHKSLRITPAMAAGISDHVWSIEEIVRLVPEPVAKKRGPYKKKSESQKIKF